MSETLASKKYTFGRGGTQNRKVIFYRDGDAIEARMFALGKSGIWQRTHRSLVDDSIKVRQLKILQEEPWQKIEVVSLIELTIDQKLSILSSLDHRELVVSNELGNELTGIVLGISQERFSTKQ